MDKNSKVGIKYVLNKARTDSSAVKTDGTPVSNSMESDLSGLVMNVSFELN